MLSHRDENSHLVFLLFHFAHHPCTCVFFKRTTFASGCITGCAVFFSGIPLVILRLIVSKPIGDFPLALLKNLVAGLL